MTDTYDFLKAQKDAILAAAVAKEREEEQKYWMPIAMQRTERIAELEAENTQLREQNTALDAKCAALEAEIKILRTTAIDQSNAWFKKESAAVDALRTELAELRGKRVALSDEQIDKLAGYGGSLQPSDTVHRNFARAVERAHGITGEAL